MLHPPLARVGEIASFDTFVLTEVIASRTLKLGEQTVRCKADGTSGAFTITLPGVSEAAGISFSIYAQTADGTNTVTVEDQNESEGWSDVVLNSNDQGVVVTSDGIRWIISSGVSIQANEADLAALTAASLTDSTGGTANQTLVVNAARTVFAFPIADMVKLADGDIVTDFIPGFAGKILKTYWIQEDPVTTASKLSTLDFEIEAAAVTGGTIALTSAACTPLGKTIEGSAVTAANVFTAANKISVVATSTTAFVEGSGTIYMVVSNDDVNDNLADLADDLNKLITDVGLIRTKVNNILTKLEGAGVFES